MYLLVSPALLNLINPTIAVIILRTIGKIYGTSLAGEIANMLFLKQERLR